MRRNDQYELSDEDRERENKEGRMIFLFMFVVICIGVALFFGLSYLIRHGVN